MRLLAETTVLVTQVRWRNWDSPIRLGILPAIAGPPRADGGGLFFDVIGVAAGALRYPLWGFLAVVGMGKMLKFLVFACACTYSIQWIIDIFRV
jgi:hypothetical protein